MPDRLHAAGGSGGSSTSFGFVVGFAILMSMFVSFTMTPMLCSRFLKLERGTSASKAGFVWRMIEGGYGWILGWSLRHRWAIVLLCVRRCLCRDARAVRRSSARTSCRSDDQSEFEVAITLARGLLARTRRRGVRRDREPAARSCAA